MLYTLIIVLIILASILMCGIVLIQESKGGGLASGFSSSNQIMGVRKTTDFLEKATWGIAIAMVVLSVVSAAFIPKQTTDDIQFPTTVTTQTDAGNVQSFPAQADDAAPAADASSEAPAEGTVENN